MNSTDYRIDVLTEDENRFQTQVKSVLQAAVDGFKNETEVKEHYWNVTTAYYLLDFRLEKIYASTKGFERPDYSLLSTQLQMYIGILKCHLLSEDYRIMQSLAAEAKEILLKKR